MSARDVRRGWEALRERLDAEGRAAKQSQSVVVDLIAAYSFLSAEDRLVVDEVISGWLNSSDEAKRFDALALIAEHRISALPALRQLAANLETIDTAGAPFELEKVRRTIRDLTRIR